MFSSPFQLLYVTWIQFVVKIIRQFGSRPVQTARQAWPFRTSWLQRPNLSEAMGFRIAGPGMNMTWYCWWKKSCTTQHVWNPVNTGIWYIYHINWCRISSINSMTWYMTWYWIHIERSLLGTCGRSCSSKLAGMCRFQSHLWYNLDRG